MGFVDHSTARITTPEQLEAFFEIQKGKVHPRLGVALLQENVITHKQLNMAIEKQVHDPKSRLGEILVAMGAVTEEAIRRVLSRKFAAPGLKLREFKIDPAVIKFVPYSFTAKYRLMPLYRTESHLVVAMEDPLASEALTDVEHHAQIPVTPVLASTEDLGFIVRQFHGEAASAIFASSDNREITGVLEVDDVVVEADERVMQLVDNIILDAMTQGATEIHVEMRGIGKPGRVRFRKNEIMVTYSETAPEFRQAIVGRIKLLAGLDAADHGPQEGRISVTHLTPAKLELRVVTMPMFNGVEDVLMRVLTEPRVMPIEELGISSPVLEELKIMAAEHRGLLLVCGPAHSGKTTTKHSLLDFINSPDRKIWTVESPIKVVHEGLCQVQVGSGTAQTFESVLRGLRSASPAVIMVGDIRGEENLKALVETALAGHMVMSGTYAISAAEGVVRLLGSGIDSFELADVLIGAVGQRLVKRLCAACRKPLSEADASEQMEILATHYCSETKLEVASVMEKWRTHYGRGKGTPALFSAAGCQECEHTGYKGRIGVYELLIASSVVKRKIRAQADREEIQRVAIAEGMKTMRQDGIEKILQGYTTLEQVHSIAS